MEEAPRFTLPDGRPCLANWSKRYPRCVSTDAADVTLTGYGFQRVSSFRIEAEKFALEPLAREFARWTHSLYAFVINNEIVRIGSSQGKLRARLGGWSSDVSAALRGEFKSTGADEVALWSAELQRHLKGDIWARRGTIFRSSFIDTEVSGFREEEYYLIAKHLPRLNRSLR
jgi:hypothetical protein